MKLCTDSENGYLSPVSFNFITFFKSGLGFVKALFFGGFVPKKLDPFCSLDWSLLSFLKFGRVLKEYTIKFETFASID